MAVHQFSPPNSQPLRISPGAAKSKRYRQRRSAGDIVAPVAIPAICVETLLAVGALTEAEVDDRLALGEALRVIALDWAARRRL
jgi:hypothetical protein